MALRVRVLGTLELDAEGDRVRARVLLRSARLRRLLAVLVMHAGEVVSLDRIAYVVWGDRPPSNVEGAVHNLVSKLRAALRDADRTGEIVLLTRAPGYMLQIPREEVDATRFEHLFARARDASADGRYQDAAALLDEALALWRGPAYAEFADADFARAEAARLQELRTTALEDRAEAALWLDRAAETVADLETLAAEHPLRERPHALLMRALYRVGRQADALEVYRGYRERLRQELGLDPSTAMRELQAAVLQHDAELDRRVDAAPAPASFAAAQAMSPSGTSGNLQTRPLDLIGRDQAVEDIVEALRSARVLTLTGPGGVGKTCLALQAAAQGRDGGGYPDGVWLCELAAIGQADAVADAVATVLAVQQRQGLTVAERLVEYLRPKRLLLVLDNIEHVAAAVAELVEAFVQGCPHLSVLATGREALKVTGEHVRPVPPLALPPPGAGAAHAAQAASVALFVQRASAAAADFALDDRNAAAVAEICRRLDGLPLAIELAAMRTRAMTPEEILTRLSARFRFLRSGRRIAAERHRTLRAVVDWSYELLDEPEQRLFERLSVFAGGFDLDAAEAVAVGGDDEAEVVDLVAQLVDKSMLMAIRGNRTSRYALLETLRDYGRERLHARGDAPEAARAHTAYHVAFCEDADARLPGPDPAPWAEAMASRIDELRAAHAWALEHDIQLALRLVAALYHYAEHRLAAEVAAWAQRTVQAAEAEGCSSPLLPAAFAVAASGAKFSGDLSRARALAERGVAIAEPDSTTRVWPLYILGEVALFEGRLDDAGRIAEETERLARAAGDTVVAAWAGSSRVLSAAYRGDTKVAGALAQELNVWAERSGSPVAVAWARYAWGESLLEANPEQAGVLLEDALARAHALGERYLAGVTLVSAVSLRGRHGDPRSALPGFLDVIDHWHQAGNRTQQWTTIRNVAVLLARLGDDERAAVLQRAVEQRATAAPAFGADADRLDETRRVLSERLGAEAFGAACDRGAAMTDDDVVAYACAALERLAGRSAAAAASVKDAVSAD